MATLTMLEQPQPIAPRPPVHGIEIPRDVTTENVNSASEGLDTKSALEIARIINHEDVKIAAAVKKALPEIAIVIDIVARALRDGGRLIYVGAGSSGRIAALDASECPPSYSTLPQQIQYIMAGGPKALASASDVNEDSPELGQRDIARRRPTRKDIVIGVSASGSTPYVYGAVEYARARGAITAAVTCNTNTPLSEVADTTIVVEVGPEVVSGSTRMKAGTAQKMVLNTFSTALMVRLGHTYRNLMVDMQPTNAKLRGRAIEMLRYATDLPEAVCATVLDAFGDLKSALVDLLSDGGVSGSAVPDAARVAAVREALRAAEGHVHAAVGRLRG
jgi:N-acetylmuramic acid 6-phosphate etherase